MSPALRSPSWRHQRGAVLVELALIIPLFISLLAVGLELGLTLRDKMTVTAATRSGARVGSSIGRERFADYDLIQSVRAGLSRIDPNDVLVLVVFKPDAAGGMPAACASTSVNGVCNRYTGTDVQTLVQSDFAGSNNCTGGSPDRRWCPMDRGRDLSAADGPEWLGVYVEVLHRTSAAAFLPDRVISDKVVMRLEPRFN